MGLRSASNHQAAAFLSSRFASLYREVEYAAQDDLEDEEAQAALIAQRRVMAEDAPLLEAMSRVNEAVDPDSGIFSVNNEANRASMGAVFEELTLDNLRLYAKQKPLGLWINHSLMQGSWSRLSNDDARRVLQHQTPHCSDYLLARPGGMFRMSSAEFLNAVRIRYGMDVYTDPFPCPLCKHGIVDVKGTHVLCSCRNSSFERIGRHNALRDEVAATARKAGLPVSLERNICGQGKQREADVLIHGFWPNGQDLVGDTACIFGGTTSDCNSRIAANDNASKAADEYGEKKKDRKFKKPVEASGQNRYAALVVTHHGSWNKKGLSVLSKLATKVNQYKGLVNSRSYSPILFQHLSCIIQRYNYRFIARRPSPDDADFDLEVQLSGDASAFDA
jgi:hypothetical protein